MTKLPSITKTHLQAAYSAFKLGYKYKADIFHENYWKH